MKKRKGHKGTFGVSPLLFFIMGLLTMAAWVAAQDAPDIPACAAVGDCGFNSTNGVGAGTRVILYDNAPGHGTSRQFLRESLERLQQEHGFDLLMTQDANQLSDANMANAKVIIFSNNDGDNYLPSGAIRTRVESFVQERGWGVIAVHAGCAFINNWTWLQDVCVQQYYHHNAAGTPADVIVEDRTIAGVAHGRANPYGAMILEGLPDRLSMNDEWYTWRGAPRTTHQYNRTTTNKVMLLRMDEGSYNSEQPTYGDDHHVVWMHTMGKGIAMYYSIGHDDTYTQGNGVFGDELLWRMIRYSAKDFSSGGGAEGCTDSEASNYDEAAAADDGSCAYAGCTEEGNPRHFCTVHPKAFPCVGSNGYSAANITAANDQCGCCNDDGYAEYTYDCTQERHEQAMCLTTGIITPSVLNHSVNITTETITINLLDETHSVHVVNVNGETVFSKTSLGFRSYDISNLEAGIYFVTVSAGEFELNRKIFKY